MSQTYIKFQVLQCQLTVHKFPPQHIQKMHFGLPDIHIYNSTHCLTWFWDDTSTSGNNTDL